MHPAVRPSPSVKGYGIKEVQVRHRSAQNFNLRAVHIVEQFPVPVFPVPTRKGAGLEQAVHGIR